VKRTHVLSLVVGIIAILFVTMAAQGQQPNQLYAFKCTRSGCPNGFNPGALIEASDGNFYGIAQGDGGLSGQGTIFKLTPSGKFTRLLILFNPQGALPTLVEAGDGNLYGVLAGYQGSIFKVSKSGKGFQVVFTFTDIDESASLTLGKDGNLYGSTAFGGAKNVCSQVGCGTIFSLNLKTGVFTTLYELNGTSDGRQPSGLIQASDGNFYGTTLNNVFRVTPTGTFTVVTQLPADDGAFGGVIQAANGTLYGMLNGAGPHLFSLEVDGSGFNVFPAIPRLNQQIEFLSTLLQPADGNLWFTTFASAGSDAIVSLSPNDSSLLQNILFPVIASPLIQATNGKLYGTAYGGKVQGGTANGQVFSLNAGQAAAQLAP